MDRGMKADNKLTKCGYGEPPFQPAAACACHGVPNVLDTAERGLGGRRHIETGRACFVRGIKLVPLITL